MLKTSRLAYGRAGTAVPTADDAYLLFSLLESTNPAPHTRRGMLCKGMVLPTSHREFAGTGGWLSVQRSKRWLINWSRAACDLERLEKKRQGEWGRVGHIMHRCDLDRGRAGHARSRPRFAQFNVLTFVATECAPCGTFVVDLVKITGYRDCWVWERRKNLKSRSIDLRCYASGNRQSKYKSFLMLSEEGTYSWAFSTWPRNLENIKQLFCILNNF